MSKQKKKHSRLYNVLSWVFTIIAALVFACAIKAFAFEFVRVDGDSMLDTLHSGELLLVTKFDYGTAWITAPWQSAEEKEAASRLVVGQGSVDRFDIAIVRYPGEGSNDFVKRIVGLPGDTIALHDGVLYVNGEAYAEPYVNDSYRKVNAEWLEELRNLGFEDGMDDGIANFAEVRIPRAGDVMTFEWADDSSNTLVWYIDGKPWPWWGFGCVLHNAAGDELRMTDYGIFLNGDNLDALEQLDRLVGQSFILDEDLYFVLGDHRNDSADSRLVGPIGRSYIVGHAQQVVFPFSDWKGL